MKIAILGGCGAMGSITAKDLLSKVSEGVDKVIVADVDLEKGRQLTSELKDSRFEFQQLNVTDKEKTCELLKTVDACLNGLPLIAGYQMDIFNYCFETKCPYTDYGGMWTYTKEQKKLHQKFVERGVPAILGLGEAPGLSNIMAKICAEHLDKVGKISMIVTWKDVSPERFVKSVKEEGAQLVGMSALLTTTMPSMKATIEALKRRLGC